MPLWQLPDFCSILCTMLLQICLFVSLLILPSHRIPFRPNTLHLFLIDSLTSIWHYPCLPILELTVIFSPELGTIVACSLPIHMYLLFSKLRFSLHCSHFPFTFLITCSKSSSSCVRTTCHQQTVWCINCVIMYELCLISLR